MSDTATDYAETMPPSWAEAIARAPNPYEVSLARYARAPIAFVREVLLAEPDEWQLKVLRALARGHTRIAVRSCHGPGKTALAAWVAVWFSNTRAPFKLAMTAPSAPQLFDALYPELIKWLDRLPGAWRELWHVTSDHITLKSNPECFITARTSRQETPEALAGLHSDNILLVVDEASGVPEQVFEAASGSMSSAGAITLLIGNPTRSSGFFWKTFNLERDRWFCMKVGHLDSPRVTADYAEEVAGRYGIDSNAYRVRVLGEFPLADADTMIAAELIDSAMLRDVALDSTEPEIWGVDVARFGTDASVLIKRRGNVVPEMPRSFHQVDTMMLAGAIKAEWDAASASRPTLICIDVIGIGAGVVDRLNEQGLPILGVNVSESPSTTGRYAKLRDELWERCGQWLATRAVRLPRHDRLRDDLAAPRYTHLSDGRLKVEDKNSMRARGLPSCDYADALNLTFCQQGLGVGSGMSGGIYDQRGMRMDLGAEVEV